MNSLEQQKEKQQQYETYVKNLTPAHSLLLNMCKAFFTGGLVPITGFANSVTTSAIEFQTEGQVFGIGCKIFTIAGPVILYGIFSSWILGIFYCILSLWR